MTDGSRIEELLASPVHRFEGRPADGPAPAPPEELREVVEIRSGLGVVGDRYFGRRAHRDAAVTLIAVENLPPGTVVLHPLGAAVSLDELRVPPGNRLEALKGDRLGQHSIGINDQWRICFVWNDSGPEEVEIVDYH